MIYKETKNKSFINMWRYLQDKGVENNSFMLELHDESLKNFKLEDLYIDDKNKRLKLIEKIKNECKNNIWFFFREIVRIPNPIAYNSNLNSIEPSYYILNPTEMMMIYAYDNNISLINKRTNKHQGIRTTLQLLELYTYFFKIIQDTIIMSYCKYKEENLRDYGLYDNLFNIFPDLDFYNEIKNNIVYPNARSETGNIINIPNHNFTEIFIYVNHGDYDKEKYYKNLYDLKFDKTYTSNIHGYIDYDIIKPMYKTYEEIIEKLMIIKLINDDGFYDYKLTTSKIFII